ncbi:hypothetical protein V8C34DRAFT_309762 [Trichoderma compactum]
MLSEMTIPVPDPISSPSSESSIEHIKEKDDRLPLTKPTEEAEQIQPATQENAEDSTDLRAQIEQLNDRLREFEESDRTKKGRKREDPELEGPELDGALGFDQRKGVSDYCANEPLGNLPFQRNRHHKAHKEMMASRAMMVGFEFNAHMEEHQDGHNHHRLDYASYDTRDDVCDLKETNEEESNATPIRTSQLNYVPWETFQRLNKMKNPFAIDVLVGEPEPKVTSIFPGMLQPATSARASRVVQTSQTREDGPVPITKPTATPIAIPPNHAQRSKTPGKPVGRGLGPLPERIRINSPAIIRLLDKISGMGDEKESESDKSDSEEEESDKSSSEEEEPVVPDPVLMMQPYRALVYYRDEIKNWKAAEDEKQSGRDPILNTKKEAEDISCLVEFIDNELEGRIAYLTSNDCQRVAFSDIWLLFKPGDIVLSKDEKQAYRVISVEYSKHCMKQPSPRDLWMYGAKARLEDFPIKIQCVYVDFDGEQLGPVLQTFSFHRFEGEKNVRSLDIIPLRLAKNADKMRETLIKRGSTFIEACSTGRYGTPMHYSGLTLDSKEEVNSQVVLDFEEAFAVHDGNNRNAKRSGLTAERYILEEMAKHLKEELEEKGGKFIFLPDLDAVAQNWKPVIKDIDVQKDECCASEIVYDDAYIEHRRSNEFIQDQFQEQGAGSLAIAPRPLKESMEDKDFITDDERLIVTYRVFGFIMRSRKWAQLDLTYLGPAKGENTFDLLVLPPGHRNMVESLVTQHYLDKASASDETDEMDIVRGKGKGLIILLHGAPGVGKTTTAECVATYFQKPLFQITCGDLGSTADVVESRLEKNFALASRWGCILLIDEADVFLEARQTENFDRNSLVAVFLRTLEYYTGILFLTTNRVGTFDEAFTSRIHISLYYPPLDIGSTLEVFRVNLDRIKERFRKKKQRGVAELELDEVSINNFIHQYFHHHEEARWNGRQIRNACETGLALAQFEAQKAANPGVADGHSVMRIVAASSKMIKVKLTAKHFKDVAKAYLAFMKYLKEVHGMSAAQQAKNFRLRHDRYGLVEPYVGPGLLASRQRRYAGGSGGGRKQPLTMQKQGLGRRGMQPPSLMVDDEYLEDDLGEYGYSEEDLYEEEQEEDAMVGEREEKEVEDIEDEQDEYPEEMDDNADLGIPEDEQYAEGDEDGYWGRRFPEDNEYLYETQPKARPQATGGSHGLNLRGRRQHTMAATAHPRTDGFGRGKGVPTSAGRSSGLPAKGKDGSGAMVWLDGLDVPNYTPMPVHFVEHYPSPAYPYEEVDSKLDENEGDWPPEDYTKSDDTSVSQTLGGAAERLNAGCTSPVIRETASSIYHVFSGSGYTEINGQRFRWKQGDTFCIPAWNKYHHAVDIDRRVYLYRFHNKPMLEAFG